MIGQLYSVPFTSTLIAAVSSSDAKTVTADTPIFIRDLSRDDVVMRKSTIMLRHPHLGTRAVKTTNAFLGVYNSDIS